MENTPVIILYGYFGILISVIVIVLVIIGSMLMKKSKSLNSERLRIWGKVCLTLGIICSIPIILTVGYILYICIG